MTTSKSLVRILMIFSFMTIVLRSNAQITSTFDSNDDGWMVSDDISIRVPDHIMTGGNSGGYVSGKDDVGGGFWFWSAPGKFLGNHSDALGKLLQFDLQQNATDNQLDYEDIIITGNGDTIVCDLPDNPGTNWTHYDVPLDMTLAWRIKNLNGPLATNTDIQNVLMNITSLRIRGEYRSGEDTGGLDNVVLPSTLMPLHLLHFTAIVQEANVLLEWSTSEEINISHFDIEHSVDGSNFVKIGIVDAVNKNTLVNTYTFSHVKVNTGFHFYRLKITDKDGACTYSPTVKISFGHKARIQIFPNPVVDKFTITGLASDRSNEIELSDMMGRVMLKTSTTLATSDVNVSQLTRGFYFVRVYTNNGVQQLKIKKQ